ncbi:hypothetical protein RM572_15070 [Streptomyces sp. DSM 42041]|uniref:Uncharacterized protein n=1 Tax=Streptomyces hazeniae TaxID=3075538 RepID=A0ABU2NSX1_9ACTN|nr:hypothetical protein [Streptomyces sp. DSM 42041]MDT0380082.1 hypothetical protein [Streptomyces sp. DSM 42041]
MAVVHPDDCHRSLPMPLPATPPTPSAPARPRRRGRSPLLVVCLAGLLATGCAQPGETRGTPGEAGPKDASPSGPAASTPSASPSPSRSASVSPPLPAAADGEDLRACADGSCEVEVSGPATVPLPDRFGLGTLRVTSVGDEDVRMLTTLTRSGFSSNGGCAATITGATADMPAHVRLTCPVGEEAVVNEMSLEVGGIRDGSTVLRIRPAG